MTALRLVRDELEKIGYSAVVSDYVFPDVFVTTAPNRTAPLAAFTHTPPSYRNAAIAVVEISQDIGPEITRNFRALGAPLLFVIEGQLVTVWEVSSEAQPVIHQQVHLNQLSSLFAENRDIWNPQRIHNAKTFGQLNRTYQLDFVDAGLLPAIEGEIHNKLDRLLNDTLAETVRLRVIRPGDKTDDRLIFRTVFRLLAAKVLQDRGHELAGMWNPEDIDTVLRGISNYYRLPPLPGESSSFRKSVFDAAWSRLRGGISFRHISSDDLAFVYENTLVTEETREHFGVHSTPRPVAEYVVNQLKLWPDDIHNTTVYEPFAGAGVFMVAALRRLRELLPVGWTEPERHKFLVARISGDEIEAFAVEVATLSLILADYPNENGWDVSRIDLFDRFTISERAKRARIVLCNPPFERFTAQERLQYPEAVARSPRKPVAALSAVLDARPDALGFVLPEPFIDGPHYGPLRERVETSYKDIEIVALPDRVFKASVIRSSLLIAQEPRQKERDTSLRSTIVTVRDRDRFLKSGEVSETRAKTRSISENLGRLWIDELDEVWQALKDLPKLGSIAEVHRGIEWQSDQSSAAQREPRKGFQLGIHSAEDIYAFGLGRPVYLDCRPHRLRGGAMKLPWGAPKLLANAARVSRGPWCFVTAIDRKGLIGSQQLFGIWPTAGNVEPSVETLCALLNSPLAVAYIASHSPPDRLRVKTIKAVPIPTKLPSGIDKIVKQYIKIIRNQPTLSSPDYLERANHALYEIDAVVLKAYDLPPRLEKRVLDYFWGERRPTLHDWAHWFPDDFQAFLPLHRYLSDEFQTAASGWVLKVFKPLPNEEAEALHEYLD